MSILDGIRSILNTQPVTPPAIIDTYPNAFVKDFEHIALEMALQVPSIKKAFHMIAGTIATFPINVYQNGHKLENTDPFTKLVTHPNNTTNSVNMFINTLTDGIWYGKSLWKVIDWNMNGYPIEWEYIAQNRVIYKTDYTTNTITQISIDTKTVPLDDCIFFDFPLIGNLSAQLKPISLAWMLQEAAFRYAKTPQPQGIIKNTGQDIDAKTIQQLKESWQKWRENGDTIAYMNSVTDYINIGFSAKDLQLIEAREHSATEIARLFGLPASALDAKTSDSMTYSNIVESRRDNLEALTPWLRIMEQTLTKYLPKGCECKYDIDTYIRDNPQTRMTTWQTALTSGILTLDEVRKLEPYANQL